MRQYYTKVNSLYFSYPQHATINAKSERLQLLLHALTVKLDNISLCTYALSIYPVEATAKCFKFYHYYRDTATLRALPDVALC